tara:strand:- start:374 stop:865 length:492 start_codon:yes stop_codon:yes gene_type:complete
MTKTNTEAVGAAFIAGYKAAHFDPTGYDVDAAANEAWEEYAAPTAKTEPSAAGLVEADVSIAARAIRQTMRDYGHNSADTTLPEIIAGSVCKALSAPTREREALRDAARTLHLAEQFIENGIELGYIRMPDKDTPDAANDMLPTIAKTSTRIDNLLNEGSGTE